MLNTKNRVITYIRQDNRNYETKKSKIFRFFRKCFIKIKMEKIENGYIILIPEYKKYSKYIIKKILQQIKKVIIENMNNYYVFEEKLSFLNKDIIDKVKILDGKELMKIYLIKILKFIFNLSNKNMNLENIYICVNKFDKTILQLLQKLTKEFKTVNIITENLSKYKRFEENMYRNGVLVTVSNNKKKSLRNAKYIINFDFPKEKIENYNVFINSIIINLDKSNLYIDKGFSGIIVNNFEVEIEKNQSDYVNEFYGKINKKIFIESVYYSSKNSLDTDNEITNQFSPKIVELVGVRGNIQKSEFLL